MELMWRFFTTILTYYVTDSFTVDLLSLYVGDLDNIEITKQAET